MVLKKRLSYSPMQPNLWKVWKTLLVGLSRSDPKTKSLEIKNLKVLHPGLHTMVRPRANKLPLQPSQSKRQTLNREFHSPRSTLAAKLLTTTRYRLVYTPLSPRRSLRREALCAVQTPCHLQGGKEGPASLSLAAIRETCMVWWATETKTKWSAILNQSISISWCNTCARQTISFTDVNCCL